MNKVDMLSRCFEVWMYSLHLPPSLLKRYAQHINQFGILSHCYVFSPLSPTKTLRSTYKTTWHHEPCLRCLFLPLEIITLNIWTKWNVIILICVNSFSYSKPICWTCEEHWQLEPFLKLISLDPTKQYRFSIWVIVIDLTWFNPFDLTKQYAQQNMWGKLLKFPAHPPYKPIRSTHEQRSETGASKRTKISCGSRSGVVRGRQGSSGVVRGRQGSSGVVRGRQESSGVVRSRQGSSGVVRGRQGSSGVVRSRRGSSGQVVRGRQGSSGVVRGRQGRQESSGVVRGRQESSGVVRRRQGSSGVVSSRQGRQESSGVVRGRQESSGVVSRQGSWGSSGVVRSRQESSGVVRSRQESSAIEVVRVVRSRQESSAEIGQLLLPSLLIWDTCRRLKDVGKHHFFIFFNFFTSQRCRVQLVFGSNRCSKGAQRRSSQLHRVHLRDFPTRSENYPFDCLKRHILAKRFWRYN